LLRLHEADCNSHQRHGHDDHHDQPLEYFHEPLGPP
jgi:hypothetical protein